MIHESTSSVIYLDYAASTPCDERVISAMMPYHRQFFANASSSSHSPGRLARIAIDTARSEAAALIGAEPDEIVWTSGATESNNLAIRGIVAAHRRLRNAPGHIVTALNEHKSVLETSRALEDDGWSVTYLRPSLSGEISPESVLNAIETSTTVISIMAGNNETGAINNIARIGSICHDKNISFHVDATQYVGKLQFDVRTINVDLLSWSGHKIYGPKGVGALYVRSGHRPVRLLPMLTGGGQEKGLRSGSLNVPGIVGFGKACAICCDQLDEDTQHLLALRDYFEDLLLSSCPESRIIARSSPRLPHISSINFPAARSGNLIDRIRHVACSSGAACDSTDLSPSHVLRSMGLLPEQAKNTLRISYGRPTRREDIENCVAHVLDMSRRS